MHVETKAAEGGRERGEALKFVRNRDLSEMAARGAVEVEERGTEQRREGHAAGMAYAQRVALLFHGSKGVHRLGE